MSSRHDVSKRRERSRSRTLERRRGHKTKEADRRSRSAGPRPRSASSRRSPGRSLSKEKNRDKRDSSKHKKSKKKKKKSSSSSGSSSSSSGSSSSGSDVEELQLLQRLEAERQRLADEKRKQKELLKANETPEEKRARRLREKAAKERRRRERMGWDTEYQSYTDQDNPFGDSALTDTFVWGKKLAREGVRHVSRAELDALARRKQLENKIELEKVKQRRLEREAERAAREAQATAAARAREAQQLSSWARQEDAFHLQQARLRSQIRIRDGRAKPIDLLAWYVSAEECADALQLQVHEPYEYLNGLRAPDLEDLLEDIKVYRELESAENQPYWEDVQTIVADELGRLRRAAAGEGGAAGAGGAGGGGAGPARDCVHRAVAGDVAQVFRGKSPAQLAQLQAQIAAKIGARGAGVDVGYWESLLSQLKAHMARARLRDRHQLNLRRKLQLLKEQQGVQPAPSPPHSPHSPHTPHTPPPSGAAESETPKQEQEQEKAPSEHSEGESEGGSEEEGEAACAAAYEAGRYSPALLRAEQLEPGTLVAEPAHEQRRLAYLRARLRPAPPPAHAHAAAQAAQAAGEEAPASAEALERAARRSLAAGGGGGDAPFGGETPLPDQPCLWADKYRPRKPRYFNRVHTGFEWNKYNQTHYDMDNPPPKVVQGYKFNIFYPDLIDNTSTPQFSLKPCADNAEFAVLRFHAGPPYEDIAFKIVNREWEYSYKRGFRCHFHNNIFQLWFHFKRYRYRR